MLHTPKSRMPVVQIANASFVLEALLNAGKGLSLCLMYIAFTINR